jgi:hypothetical protein
MLKLVDMQLEVKRGGDDGEEVRLRVIWRKGLSVELSVVAIGGDELEGNGGVNVYDGDDGG